MVSPECLGSPEFAREFGIKYNYLSGSMYKGIASPEMIIAMGKSGFMGFLGTGGLSLKDIERSIDIIDNSLSNGEAFGLNMLSNYDDPKKEFETVQLYLRRGIRCVEASAYISLTPALVMYRLRGLESDKVGNPAIYNRIIAKVSRPEVAEIFLNPAPEEIVYQLLSENFITQRQLELAKYVPMADALCIEADSGGHTDQGNPCVLLPAIKEQARRIYEKQTYPRPVWIGAAGGIGSPASAAAAFIMGADFILTGSINQCTVEAGTSDIVKDMLQEIGIQDTAYAPSGDMFELGAKVQVLKRGTLFSSRGNKLYDLYTRYNSLREIDDRTTEQIQDKYFRKSFEEVWRETASYLERKNPELLESVAQNEKKKMAHIFKWYFIMSTRMAMAGIEERKTDFQVHCGPALGSFNQWVKGGDLESWRSRHVNDIGLKIMQGASDIMRLNYNQLSSSIRRPMRN
ncbi:MAG: PfaD family polyunsaturated fatty acid/polyketide biosynthesis protein [Exilibacterium sp.]